jgi:hypothetical protein
VKSPGWLPVLVLVLSSIAFAQPTNPAANHRDSQSTFPAAASEKPVFPLIAQTFKAEMDAQCRAWQNDKNAPVSAAWVCVNGRQATQKETNEALEKFRQEGQRTVRQWDERHRQDLRKMDEMISGRSRPVPDRQPNTILEPRLQANQPVVEALSLPADWRFAHPHPDALMAIHVAALRQSSTLQELVARLPEPLQVNATNVGSTLKQIGEVDQAWISMQSGDLLTLLQGRLNFPPGFVELGNGMTSYRISSTAVVLGRAASVAEAVQRLANAGAVLSPTVRRMKVLGAENDVWFSGTPAALAMPAVMPLSNDLTGLSLALALHDGLKLQLRLNSGTLAGARRLLAAMRKNPALPDSSVSVDTQLEGTSVRLTLSVDKTELSKALDRALAAPLGQQLTAMAATSARSTNKVVIQGLPGGTQEVQGFGQLAPAPATTTPLGTITIQGLKGGPKVISSPH